MLNTRTDAAPDDRRPLPLAACWAVWVSAALALWSGLAVLLDLSISRFSMPV